MLHIVTSSLFFLNIVLKSENINNYEKYKNE